MNFHNLLFVQKPVLPPLPDRDRQVIELPFRARPAPDVPTAGVEKPPEPSPSMYFQLPLRRANTPREE
jgi:hypothetical protein